MRVLKPACWLFLVAVLFSGLPDCPDRLLMAAPAPATGPAATQPASESAPARKDGIAVSVAQTRTTFSDEQPAFVVRLRNVGTEPRNLYDVTAFWNWTIELTSVGPALAIPPGPWRLRMHNNPDRHHIDHRRIQPGEVTEVTVDLNEPPFTFDYTYEGPMDQPVRPVRRLHPGRYRLTVVVALTHPFGNDHSQWSGPVTTNPVELTIEDTPQPAVTKQQQQAFAAAISRVTDKLEPHGLWMNGVSPRIDLPGDAPIEDVIDAAVNQSTLGSKGYRILQVQPFSRDHGPGPATGSAALLRIGKAHKVIILFPLDNVGWWSRFYDTEVERTR
jgi:hypothetical protein